METILSILLIISWVWSVVRSVEVSVPCLLLNITFPPLSQLIFSLYEPRIRAPFFLMMICVFILFMLADFELIFQF